MHMRCVFVFNIWMPMSANVHIGSSIFVTLPFRPRFLLDAFGKGCKLPCSSEDTKCGRICAISKVANGSPLSTKNSIAVAIAWTPQSTSLTCCCVGNTNTLRILFSAKVAYLCLSWFAMDGGSLPLIKLSASSTRLECIVWNTLIFLPSPSLLHYGEIFRQTDRRTDSQTERHSRTVSYLTDAIFMICAKKGKSKIIPKSRLEVLTGIVESPRLLKLIVKFLHLGQ